MILDVFTITVIGCIVQISLSIPVFLQYKINKTFRGIGLWFIGSSFLSFSFILMFLFNNKTIWKVSILGNPLLILGHLFLYLGVTSFLEITEKKRLLILHVIVSISAYLYYVFFIKSTIIRAVIIATSLAIISLLTAYKFFFGKNKTVSTTTKFTGNVFLFYGIFQLAKIPILLNNQNYASHSLYIHSYFNFLSYTVQIIVSILWTFGFIIMINYKLNEKNLEEKEKLKVIFNTNPDAKLITKMKDGTFLDVNKGFTQMTGYNKDEIIGLPTSHINIWDSLEERNKFIEELSKKDEIENREVILRKKDGSIFIGSLSSKIINIDEEQQIVSVIHDITNRKKSEIELNESKELYSSIINSAPDNITIADIEGNILMVSPAGKRMFGYEPNIKEIELKMNILDFLVPEDRLKAREKNLRMINGEVLGPVEYIGLRCDGTVFNIEVNTDFIKDTCGKPIKMVIAIRDTTERKESEKKIKELILQLEIEKNTEKFKSITDSLTGIANRRYFDEVINKEFYRLKRSEAPLSLIMLDVDYFKNYNDTYGHLAGDNCLRQIGSLLNNAVGRVHDIVTRYGGEEFAVILPETNLEGAISIAESIRIAVENLKIPHKNSENANYVTVSVGITTVNTRKIETIEEVIARADDALYKAKKNGRNRVEIY